MKKKDNNVFIIILFVLLAVSVVFLPKIYKYFEDTDLPKIEGNVETKSQESKVVDSEILESVHYPLMRNSIYSENTYYSLKEFTVDKMSNRDILLSAFLDMYEGNITDSDTKGSCTNLSKQFNKDYIELRIKNILGKNVNYKLENFEVPEDSNSNFKGEWIYDSSNSRFIYNGICKISEPVAKYYNLEDLIEAYYEKDNLVIYYYVGFAKVIGNSYTIYSDPNMKNEISKGSFVDLDTLKNVFKSIDKSNKKIYKYTFKDTLCSYNEYCLYKGEWAS